MPTSRRRRAVRTALAALALASCGGEDSPDARETTTTTAASSWSTSTTLSPEAEVEAAYHEVEALLAELGQYPDPDDPRLPTLVLEPELSEIRESLAQAAAANHTYELGEESSHRIVSTSVAPSGDTAILIVCTVGADRLVDRDTGTVIAEGVATIKGEVSYRRHEGRWMLEDRRVLESWDGIVECA
jgi:hypothetical protein